VNFADGINVHDLIMVEARRLRMTAWDRILLDDPFDPPANFGVEPWGAATSGTFTVSAITSATTLTISLPSPEPTQAPFPRNHRERRIWNKLGREFDGLGKAVREAELALGPRAKAESLADWNHRFWERVKRKVRRLEL
jgi:hypothetical protein